MRMGSRWCDGEWSIVNGEIISHRSVSVRICEIREKQKKQ